MNIQWNSEKKSLEKIYYAKHVVYLIYLKFVYNFKTNKFYLKTDVVVLLPRLKKERKKRKMR